MPFVKWTGRDAVGLSKQSFRSCESGRWNCNNIVSVLPLRPPTYRHKEELSPFAVVQHSTGLVIRIICQTEQQKTKKRSHLSGILLVDWFQHLTVLKWRSTSLSVQGQYCAHSNPRRRSWEMGISPPALLCLVLCGASVFPQLIITRMLQAVQHVGRLVFVPNSDW